MSGRQSRFTGSDRQGRGALVDALRSAPVPEHEVAALLGWADDPERTTLVVDGLVADGLAVRSQGCLMLPE